MLQRLQTVLLLLALLFNLAALFLPLWSYDVGDAREVVSGLELTATGEEAGSAQQSFMIEPLHLGYVVLTGAASLLLLVTIFLYKNRILQIRLSMVAIILIMLELVAIALFTREGPHLLSGLPNTGIPQYGLALSVLALILTWWAIRRIRKDEELVRSVDRIR